MTSINPFGARPYTNTSSSPLADNKQQSPVSKSASAPVKVPGQDQVALSSNGIDLQQRIAGLGNATVDLAQSLLGSFAEGLFGDAMKGATIDFDSVSLESNSAFAAGVSRSQAGGKVTQAAGFSLQDSSHFMGKGTITLADGQKYDFEVEVLYEASTTAVAGSESEERKQLAAQNPAMPLPAVEFPDIEWPGSLNDLFKMMDKQISGTIQNKADGATGAEKLGTLSLRLMNLVNNESALDIYSPPEASAKSKHAANAYAAVEKQAAPIKVGPGQSAPGPVVDKQAAPVKVPISQSAPAPEPVVDTQQQPVRSGGDIPLTISTTPKPDDAA